MGTPKARKYPPIIGRYVALAALWDSEGGASPPPFCSENSARWFIRENRAALVDAQAIAIDMRRVLVDVERLAEVRERVAVEAARSRLQAA